MIAYLLVGIFAASGLAHAADDPFAAGRAEVKEGYARCQAEARLGAASAPATCRAALEATQRLLDRVAAQPEAASRAQMMRALAERKDILVAALPGIDAFAARRAAGQQAVAPLSNGGASMRVTVTRPCPPLTGGDAEPLEVVYFAPSSARLRASAAKALEAAATALLACPGVRVEVRGHADDPGGDEVVVELSQRRAAAVVDWLVAHGVPGEQLLGTALGGTVPVADGATALGRKANRRVDFQVAGTAPPSPPSPPVEGVTVPDAPPLEDEPG